MPRRRLERAFSLCLAAAVTVTLLGGIGQLATPRAAQALWAAQAVSCSA